MHPNNRPFLEDFGPGTGMAYERHGNFARAQLVAYLCLLCAEQHFTTEGAEFNCPNIVPYVPQDFVPYSTPATFNIQDNFSGARDLLGGYELLHASSSSTTSSSTITYATAMASQQNPVDFRNMDMAFDFAYGPRDHAPLSPPVVSNMWDGLPDAPDPARGHMSFNASSSSTASVAATTQSTTTAPQQKPFVATRNVRRVATRRRAATSVASFTCDQCGDDFTRGFNFKSHMNAHNGVKPYACKICGKHFVRTNEVSRHQKKCDLK